MPLCHQPLEEAVGRAVDGDHDRAGGLGHLLEERQGWGMQQCKLINKEIVALIANLPDEFIARKGSYWRLGYNILEPFGNPYHLKSHMDQMQAALDAARKK